MLQSIQALIITLALSAITFADVFITEITDPQNSSDAGRYVELHNNGASDIDLSSGWALQRWTNANADPQSAEALSGTISAGGFYIVCNNSDKFSETYGLTCDQDFGTGDAADSNGDDNIALLDASGTIVDMFGVAGEDGSGTGHEFEDGRAERAASNTTASSVWEEAGWNIDNDSGGGNGPRYAPEDFDPYAWIGSDSGGDDGGSNICEDETACNLGAEGSCEYPVTNYDCDGNCTAELDCLGLCGGSTVIDECGECGGTGASCAEPAANLFFSEHAEGSSNNKYFEVYNASDGDVSLSQYAYVNCSNGCTEWEYTNNFADGATVLAGAVYTVCHTSFAGDLSLCNETRTLYHNGDDAQGLMYLPTSELLDIFGLIGDDPGSGWSVAGVENATKDHTLVRKSSVTIGNTDWVISSGSNADDSEWVVLDQNTWDYMGSHPHDFTPTLVSGCMDSNATNYDANATEQSYNEFGTSTCTYTSCEDIPTETGCLFDDGTSAEWWDGWWNCTEAGGSVCGLAEVVFELDLPSDISGTPHVNGTYNGWCGSCFNNMSDDDGDGIWSHIQYFTSGEVHDYKFTIDGWNAQEDLTGLDCAVEADGYWNRQFTAGDSNSSQTLSFCYGSCEATCDAPSNDCGNGTCDENEDCSSCSEDCGECPSYSVTFNIDGVEDCDFVSVTGSFDGWSGWGAHSDNGMTVELLDGDYEYTILCVNAEEGVEWWTDIWAYSTQYSAPQGSECDAIPDDEYPNYGFSVLGSDTTVSVCAGSCEEVCPETYDITFNVNVNYAGDIDTENGVRLFGLSSWSSDDAISMECDENGHCSATVSLLAGTYQFKYRNGWNYENVDDLPCASLSGDYWNRDLTVSESSILGTVCFGACEDCVPGCTDSIADNYDEGANADDGSCDYPVIEPDNLFFSEYAEGSSNNKYLEIYNASDSDVDLSGYSLSSCSNGCDDGVSWDYPDNVTFDSGTTVASGDVFVVCHGSSDDLILAECDQTFTYLSNGDDVFGLTQIGSGALLDVIGAIGEDPGSGWEVAGVGNATKDHTLVRDGSVGSGNSGNWEESAGDADGSEWIVLDQNTWSYLGSHPHNFAETCNDENACNAGEEGDCTYPEEGYDCNGNAYINVTFNVNMSDQMVDTEGYGLDLYIDDPYGYHDMFDDDGDGIWSTTLTLVANTTYNYKFKNGSEWEVSFNDLGCGAGDDYGNRTFTSGDSDMVLDSVCFNSCSECEAECSMGDVNGDSSVDVLDIVQIVDSIINGEINFEIACSDINADGSVDILDIVQIVDLIFGGRLNDANSANISIGKDALLISSNGYIGGIQMTLTHGNDFKLNLTSNALVADYRTTDNSTKLVIVEPRDEKLFSYSGEFEISDIIIANSNDRIDVVISPMKFNMSPAYPNPFNPTTNMTLDVPEAGFVSVKVYNVAGQVVATLMNGNMDASNYNLAWDASNASSGMYFVKAEVSGETISQKLVLMK